LRAEGVCGSRCCALVRAARGRGAASGPVADAVWRTWRPLGAGRLLQRAHSLLHRDRRCDARKRSARPNRPRAAYRRDLAQNTREVETLEYRVRPRRSTGGERPAAGRTARDLSVGGARQTRYATWPFPSLAISCARTFRRTSRGFVSRVCLKLRLKHLRLKPTCLKHPWLKPLPAHRRPQTHADMAVRSRVCAGGGG
jgi:hypothetical protein